MKLITGGAWQGKLDYVRQMFFGESGLQSGQTAETEVIRIADGENGTEEEMKRAQVINHFHLWIRRQMEAMMAESGYPAGGFAAELTEQMELFDHQEMLLCQEKAEQSLRNILEENPDVILICDELGCGIIPMKAFDRRYRELVGRICCMLAREASEVHRVVCGIGEIIRRAADETGIPQQAASPGEDETGMPQQETSPEEAGTVTLQQEAAEPETGAAQKDE